MSKTNPLFSIVIANYNHGKYIESAINSVINQDFDDYELIVIDGGSTDNSVDIIKQFSNKISWWISEKDSGQSNAFNKGFSHAKGQFYFWLNADDLLLPNSLQRAKNMISKNQSTRWFTANTIFFSKDGLISKCSIGPKWNSFLIKHNPIFVNGPTSIFHNSLLKKVGGFNEGLHFTMDGDLWYKFYNKNEKFIRINHFFWGFRIHEKSKTSHAFKNNASNDFINERKFVLEKNSHKLKRTYACLLILYKLVTGIYLKSLFYTYSNKSKHISKFK